MSKKQALPRLDAQITRNARYPDVNEFLKNTQYASQSTNYLDNQAAARLTPVLSRGDSLQLSTVNIAGFSRAVYLTSISFYGYNPDVEVLDRVVVSLPTFPGFAQVSSRTNADYQLTIISGSEANVGSSLTNYKIVLSTRAVTQILSHVFDKSAQLAFDYFSVGETDDAVYSAERLLSFVTSNLYALSIPLTFSYYYFNSSDPAFSLVTTLSFKDLLSFLREDFAPNSVSLTLSSLYAHFQLNVFAKRPVLLNVTIQIADKSFQQETPVYSAGVQQIFLSAGYLDFFSHLATQTTIGYTPQVSATYTYKPIGYTSELVAPAPLSVQADSNTPAGLIMTSWFFGNLANEPNDGGSNYAVGSTWFRATFTSKTQFNAAGVCVRADNNTQHSIDQPVFAGNLQNEMAEFTTLFTPEDLFQPVHQTALLASLANSNKLFYNGVWSSRTTSQALNPKFTRLVTNVNQVTQTYDTVAALTPKEAVLARSQLSAVYDAKNKNYVYTLSIRWPYYAQASVLWPFLTGSRLVVTFIDLLTRPVATAAINKNVFQVYSAAQILANPLRTNRVEANVATQYRRWFPKYSQVLVNGRLAPSPAKKLSFSVNALASSVSSPVFSTDWSQVKEIPIVVTKQSNGVLLEATTEFFTRSFFKKFVNRFEQYGYFVDQAVVAVSVSKGGKQVFSVNRAAEPYLAALDPAGSAASVGLGQFVGRFISKSTLSYLARQIVGTVANRPVNGTIYLVTGLHPVFGPNKKILYYEVIYDTNYRIVPGIVFTLKGAW